MHCCAVVGSRWCFCFGLHRQLHLWSVHDESFQLICKERAEQARFLAHKCSLTPRTRVEDGHLAKDLQRRIAVATYLGSASGICSAGLELEAGCRYISRVAHDLHICVVHADRATQQQAKPAAQFALLHDRLASFKTHHRHVLQSLTQRCECDDGEARLGIWRAGHLC